MRSDIIISAVYSHMKKLVEDKGLKLLVSETYDIRLKNSYGEVAGD